MDNLTKEDQDRLQWIRGRLDELRLALDKTESLTRKWDRLDQMARSLQAQINYFLRCSKPPEPPFTDSRPIDWIKSGHEGRREKTD